MYSTLLRAERAALAWCVFLLATTAVYITIGITRPVAFALGAVFLCVGFLGRRWFFGGRGELVSGDAFPALAASALALQLLMAVVLFFGQSDASLQSPWSEVPWWIFVVYFFETCLLLWAAAQKNDSRVFWAAVYGHFFVTYGAALLVFRYGYGFDPLIHAAAEKFSVIHGHITPLQPFYNGFYAPIVWMHGVFGTPVDIINRWLVPVLAVFSVPTLLYHALRARGADEAHARVGVVLASVLAVREFTLSVPHNLTALFVVWWACIMTLPRTRQRILLLYAVSAAALVVHPLLGVPIFIATVIFHAQRRAIALVGYVAIAGAPLALFSVYRVLHGLPFLAAQIPGAQNIATIFGFQYDVSHSRLLVQLAFGFAFLLPYAALAAGLRKKNIALLVSFAASICLVAALAVLPNIAWYEQNEFALRMRFALPLFILPEIIFWLESHVARKKIFFILIAATATISWYFSYPGNTGVTNPGYNASAADYAAVNYITTRTGTKSYVVLAPQITSGVARSALGFDYVVTLKNGDKIFPYAEGQNNEIANATNEVFYSHFALSDFGNLFAEKISALYVVVPTYWYRKENLLGELLAANPRDVVPLEGATIFVFE